MCAAAAAVNSTGISSDSCPQEDPGGVAHDEELSPNKAHRVLTLLNSGFLQYDTEHGAYFCPRVGGRGGVVKGNITKL
jgi:hypothetical protein